jgi:hypothetical protein
MEYEKLIVSKRSLLLLLNNYEVDSSLLRCDVVSLCEELTKFWRTWLLPFSELKKSMAAVPRNVGNYLRIDTVTLTSSNNAVIILDLARRMQFVWEKWIVCLLHLGGGTLDLHEKARRIRLLVAYRRFGGE